MNNTEYYVLVGDRKTWNISVKEKVWGFSEKTKGFWNKCNSGDSAIFYVTSPMKKIIGFGTFGRKFESDELLWPEEKLLEKPIWTYKIKIKILHIQDNWKNGITMPKEIILNQGRKKITKEMFLHLFNKAESEWKIKIPKLS